MTLRRNKPVNEATSDLASKLVVEEYRTLRDEAHRSLEYAQSIVRWSLAIFGVVLAAGLLAAEKLTAQAPPSLHYAVLLLFGFALPGLMWSAMATWFGELLRMERSGAYLRGLERELAAIPEIRRLTGHAPLRWEGLILSQRGARAEDGKKSLLGKQLAAYIGTAAIFVGSTLLSLALFAIFWGLTYEWPNEVPAASLWWLGSAMILEVGCAIVVSMIGSRVKKLGASVADLTEANS